MGGFIGIWLVIEISQFWVGDEVPLIVASMGASAVLLFAVPHGSLSQPWPLLGGHLVSAFIGITCLKLVPHLFLAAALAVSLAIAAMYYLRCIHPPGGATALTAVVGGNAIEWSTKSSPARNAVIPPAVPEQSLLTGLNMKFIEMKIHGKLLNKLIALVPTPARGNEKKLTIG